VPQGTGVKKPLSAFRSLSFKVDGIAENPVDVGGEEVYGGGAPMGWEMSHPI